MLGLLTLTLAPLLLAATAAAQALIDDTPDKSHFAGNRLGSFTRPVAGDFDRDGDLDLVVFNPNAGLRLYLNDA